MTICENVIRSAYRRSGVVAAGVAISAANVNVGLERLQDLYNKMLGDGLLGQVTDYYLPSGNYTALENQRIYKQSPASVVTIPATVRDPDTGLTRPPLDGAVIVVIDPTATPFTTQISLYDAQNGWARIDGLAISSFAPLSGRYEDGLKNLLAVFLADDSGIPINTVLAHNAASARLMFTSKYDQPRKPGVVEYF